MLPSCRNLFKSCSWMSKDVDCCSILDLQESHAGYCFSFNSCTCMGLKDRAACKPRHGNGEGEGLVIVTHRAMANEVVDSSPTGRGFLVSRHAPTVTVGERDRGLEQHTRDEGSC